MRVKKLPLSAFVLAVLVRAFGFWLLFDCGGRDAYNSADLALLLRVVVKPRDDSERCLNMFDNGWPEAKSRLWIDGLS